MNNTQVDKSNEALHKWVLGETYPLLQVMLEIAPMQMLEQELTGPSCSTAECGYQNTRLGWM